MQNDQQSKDPKTGVRPPYLDEVPDQKAVVLEVLLREYTALKAESTARIGFRDALLYTTLGAVGVVFAYVASNRGSREALLVIPWVTFILGWAYLVNDLMVSRLGKFVRVELTRQMNNSFACFRTKHGELYLREAFRWEPFHRSDPRRIQRKWIQLFVDWATFVGPTVVAICAYLVPGIPGSNEWPVWILIAASIGAAGFLGVQIWNYADTFSSKVEELADLAKIWKLENEE